MEGLGSGSGLVGQPGDCHGKSTNAGFRPQPTTALNFIFLFFDKKKIFKAIKRATARNPHIALNVIFLLKNKKMTFKALNKMLQENEMRVSPRSVWRAALIVLTALLLVPGSARAVKKVTLTNKPITGFAFKSVSIDAADTQESLKKLIKTKVLDKIRQAVKAAREKKEELERRGLAPQEIDIRLDFGEFEIGINPLQGENKIGFDELTIKHPKGYEVSFGVKGTWEKPEFDGRIKIGAAIEKFGLEKKGGVVIDCTKTLDDYYDGEWAKESEWKIIRTIEHLFAKFDMYVGGAAGVDPGPKSLTGKDMNIGVEVSWSLREAVTHQLFWKMYKKLDELNEAREHEAAWRRKKIVKEARRLGIDPDGKNNRQLIKLIREEAKARNEPERRIFAAPPPPAGVSATDGTYADKVRVSWSEVPGATSYKVYRSKSILVVGSVIGNPGRAGFDDTSAEPGKEYYYRVRTVRESKAGDYSSYDTGYSQKKELEAPSGVSATDGAYEDKVRVTWSPVPGVAAYKVFRSTTAVAFGSEVGVARRATFDDGSASPCRTYYYRVKSVGLDAESDFSPDDSGYVKPSDKPVIKKVRDANLTVGGLPRGKNKQAFAAPGTITAFGGAFKEHGVDESCDPAIVQGPFELLVGGKLTATIKGTPPVPLKWSLHNTNTGLKVVYEPRLGSGYGPGQAVISISGDHKTGRAEASEIVPGPGRVTVMALPPSGAGPLSGSCYKQSFQAKVELAEVSPDMPARGGRELNPGDLLSTGRNGLVLVDFPCQGSVWVGPNTRVKVETVDSTAGSKPGLRLIEGNVRSISLPNGMEAPVVLMGKKTLQPEGTEFQVETQGEQVRLKVRSGQVRVLGPEGLEQTVQAGKQYDLATGQSSALEPEKEKDGLIDGLRMDELALDSNPQEAGKNPAELKDNRLTAGWLWQDPKHDAKIESAGQGGLKITVPDGNEMWQSRADSPRLLHKATGDFDLELELTQHCAGQHLAITEFLLYAPGSYLGFHAKQARLDAPGCDYLLMGGAWYRYENRNRLPVYSHKLAQGFDPGEAPFHFRFSRRGKLVLQPVESGRKKLDPGRPDQGRGAFDRLGRPQFQTRGRGWPAAIPL